MAKALARAGLEGPKARQHGHPARRRIKASLKASLHALGAALSFSGMASAVDCGCRLGGG